jgi:O-palmitoleoyl-L-serine hydrolase
MSSAGGEDAPRSGNGFMRSTRTPSRLSTSLAIAAILAACGGQPSGAVTPPHDDAALDGGAPENVDAASSSSSVDAAPPPFCTSGQGASCSALGGSFSGGNAPCRADGRGWDVTTCALASPGQTEMVKPAERDPARFAVARCNDGTPFGFAIRLAPKPSSSWTIYLEGGEMCDDYAKPCSERELRLMTTRPRPDRSLGALPASGLFSALPAVNPSFFDQNQVYAFYCSSDVWAGATTDRRPSSGDPARGWYFSGHANVDAMLAVLVERYGLDDSQSTLQVLFGGGSAGAFGAHINEARVGATLPSAASAGRLKLFVDAGWTTDWDEPGHRIGIATTPDRDVWKRARSFWAATFDPDCEAASAEPSTCFMAPTWYPFVAKRVPVLIQQSSFDAAFTNNHKITAPSPTAAKWRAQVTSSLAGATWLFSGASPYHTLALTNAGMQTGPTGNTLAEVLARFWSGRPPERVLF